SQGMDPQRRYWHPAVGYNYRMTNVATTVGLAQMERVYHHLPERRRVAAAYDARLADLECFILRPIVEPWAEHVYWMYTVLLGEEAAISRDAVIEALAAEGIETRPTFHPMHATPPYAHLAGDFPVAEDLS